MSDRNLTIARLVADRFSGLTRLALCRCYSMDIINRLLLSVRSN